MPWGKLLVEKVPCVQGIGRIRDGSSSASVRARNAMKLLEEAEEQKATGALRGFSVLYRLIFGNVCGDIPLAYYHVNSNLSTILKKNNA